MSKNYTKSAGKKPTYTKKIEGLGTPGKSGFIRNMSGKKLVMGKGVKRNTSKIAYEK